MSSANASRPSTLNALTTLSKRQKDALLLTIDSFLGAANKS
jgi:hypothetical protein